MFILLFLSEFVIKPDTSPVIIWLILAIAVLFGVLMGFLAMVLPKAGATCAAIWLGIIVSFLLQDAFLYKFANNNIVLYVVMGCLCLLFAILAWFYFDLMLILSTSLFGVITMIQII
jgi:putative flippase GtrA